MAPFVSTMSSLPLLSRRELLTRMGGGLGALGLTSALQGAGVGVSTHFMPKAKRVIHLFMNGGPFGPDLVDPKPMLTKFNGQRAPHWRFAGISLCVCQARSKRAGDQRASAKSGGLCG